MFSLITNYHQQHKNDTLTIRSLRVLLLSAIKPTEQGNYRGTINRLKKCIIKDPSVVDDVMKMFVKRQKLKQAINGALDSLDRGEEGDLERVRQKVDEAISVDSNQSEESYDYFKDHVSHVHEDNSELRIATKISKELDTHLNGGLGPGEIAMFIAPTGVGKTLALVNVGVGAMRQGKKVVHATLEISPRKVARRYDVCITGCTFKEIAESPELVEKRTDKLKLLGAGLHIKDYTGALCSVNDLRAYLERIYSKGFKFDLLIVDHSDLLYSTAKYAEKRHELSSIVSGLRRIGAEFGVPVWTASQATRKAGATGATTLWDIAEDIGKANWADLAITISQKDGEKDDSIAWLQIAKTRLGKGNPKFMVAIDYDTMRMRGTKDADPYAKKA
jgi:replicative DNA helicase